MIPVTKPYLPLKEKYLNYINDIFQRNWLTNNGPLVNDLELKLKQYLGLDHLLYVSNGTIAIQLAIKALHLTQEIITTPFSYVATTSSIVWENCIPVYVDIDPETLNIDANNIEEAITEKTSAILATHCFGNACDIDAIEVIAKKHNLKVIYDAAHCFGSTYKGKSIFEYGDISTCSLHATKIMHSVEGGFLSTQNPDILKKLAYLRNFGHDGPEKFNGVGINAKNSEFHAAMGLCVLSDFEQIIQKRKNQALFYQHKLNDVSLIQPKVQKECGYNYAYFPILLKSEEQTIKLLNAFESSKIYPRRYFYPPLNLLDYVKNTKVPISEDVAKRILCLPVYHSLSHEEQDLIVRIIKRTLKYD